MSLELLAGRNTVSKKIPEIDSLYVYSTRHDIKFTHRMQPGVGYKYKNHKAIMSAGEDEIHIYHGTVTLKGVKKALTLVTKQSDEKAALEFFTKSADEIEKSKKLFDKFARAKASPSELGIYYTY